jgi:UDP-N-acetylglucosamine 4,6-dehydratase
MTGGEVFIPKIPSMRVVDLAEAIAPGMPREVVGIRPGEKLHELMLTSDESRHTIDAGDVYVVVPEHMWWDERGVQVPGRPVPEGFVYSSDGNDWWLSAEELGGLLRFKKSAAA